MPATSPTILDQIGAEKTKVSERLARLDTERATVTARLGTAFRGELSHSRSCGLRPAYEDAHQTRRPAIGDGPADDVHLHS
jgi:hypothetical protein